MEREKIIKILFDSLKNDAAIADDALLFDDLGFSSLEMMTILFEIEDSLDITIDFSKLAGTKTVGQLICMIESMT